MEDTERYSGENWVSVVLVVTVVSIRWRILKVGKLVLMIITTFGYSGLDPMEEGWRSPDCLR